MKVFDDPTAAFANLTRAVDPGGRVTFTVFRERARNPWVGLPTRTLAAFLDDPTDLGPEPQGFAFADPRHVEHLLTEVRLVDVHVEPVQVAMTMGGGGGIGPAARQVSGQLLAASILRRLPIATRRRAHQALREVLADHLVDGEVQLAASAWVVTARTRR